MLALALTLILFGIFFGIAWFIILQFGFPEPYMTFVKWGFLLLALVVLFGIFTGTIPMPATLRGFR